MRQIVDVLRSACEMDEFRSTRYFDDVRESFLQPIFDRLDVVIGRTLIRSASATLKSR